MVNSQLDPYQAMTAGLARAKARGAPKGYENQPHWTAFAPVQAGLNGRDLNGDELMRLYRQREQDRKEAAYRENPTGPAADSFFSTAGDNMAGFFEGLSHNDTIANIDPTTGDVVGPPKQSRVNVGSLNLPGTTATGQPIDTGAESRRQSSKRLQRGTIDQNQAYSLTGLRNYVRGQ